MPQSLLCPLGWRSTWQETPRPSRHGPGCCSPISGPFAHMLHMLGCLLLAVPSLFISTIPRLVKCPYIPYPPPSYWQGCNQTQLNMKWVTKANLVSPLDGWGKWVSMRLTCLVGSQTLGGRLWDLKRSRETPGGWYLILQQRARRAGLQ